MDNLTHSLTGALAAKIIETAKPAAVDEAKQKRQVFWLLVASANLPDIDVALGFLGDPIFSISHHRGITHSLLFAPVLALFPAALFCFWGKLKNFKMLWRLAWFGILMHIFFDVITPFGTQLFAPFSKTKYALDWMFIIDPFFTGILALTLLLGKLFKSRRQQIILGGSIFVVLYLSVEMLNHHRAYKRMEEAMRREGIAATKISALPQPLSIFRWMGMAQTERGVVQTFFSLFVDKGNLQLTKYENAIDKFVARVLQTEEAKWYKTFARHPWIRSEQQGDRHVVELHDLKFSIDKFLLTTIGTAERFTPFILRYSFSLDGDETEIAFDGESLSP
ncbi:MAG: metal-dependent hydrolase [bacterium]